jgi:hypothetical protein
VKNNAQKTIVTPTLLSITQRNVSLRPQSRFITPYSLFIVVWPIAGDVGGRVMNGYENIFQY